jgi:hypothetical protein
LRRRVLVRVLVPVRVLALVLARVLVPVQVLVRARVQVLAQVTQPRQLQSQSVVA